MSADNEWLSLLKVGDTAVAHAAAPASHVWQTTVARRTKTQVITTDGGRYRLSDGRAVASTGYSYGKITTITPALALAFERERLESAIRRYMPAALIRMTLTELRGLRKKIESAAIRKL